MILKKISIVLPIHNEVGNLEKLLSEWNFSLNGKINFEFVLVEDGSTDGTKELIKNLEYKYPILNLSTFEKRGYSRAVLDGIKASTGDYILCTDSDNQIKVSSLVENLKNLPEEETFLFGYRFPRKDPLNRLLYSALFKVLHDIIFNSKLKDPSCPFVIGNKNDFQKLPDSLLLKMKEGFWWGFVGVCLKFKIKFKEVPIQHFARSEGEAGYKLFNLPKIILRNTLGIIIIKFSKI